MKRVQKTSGMDRNMAVVNKGEIWSSKGGKAGSNQGRPNSVICHQALSYAIYKAASTSHYGVALHGIINASYAIYEDGVGG